MKSPTKTQESRAARVSRVAKMLDISISQAYLLVRQGVLPSIRLSERTIRIPLDAVNALLDNR